MALFTLRRMLTAPFDVVNKLFALDLINHGGLHGCTGDHRASDAGGIAAKHQDVVELDGLTRLCC